MRALRLLAVNLLLLVVLLEAAGVAFYLHRTGRLFYGDVRATAARAGIAEGLGTTHSREHLSVLRLHPYLGFIQRPGITPREFFDQAALDRSYGPGLTPPWIDLVANGEGFFSAHAYPTPADPEAFVVGIFGGSVAQFFALQGADALREALAGSPAVGGRRVEVLPFAVAGYKQPQQLQTLAYFLDRGQRFDLVVTLDGFNEVALPELNVAARVAPQMPSVLHVKPLVEMLDKSTLSRDRLRVLAEADALKDERARVEQERDTTRFAFVWAALDLRSRALDRALERARVTLLGASATPVDESLFFLAPAAAGAQRDPARWQGYVALWQEGALGMEALLRASGTPFLAVLQPNQYYTHKTFGPDEERIARGGSSLYRPSVETGYPLLQRGLGTLAERGVATLDATSVFDAVTEATYFDNCCHYTQRGNELLARAVGERVRALLETAP